MTTVNKIYNYENFKFNIKVEFNTKVEKRLNGLIFHTITINDLGATNYDKKVEVIDSELEKQIILLQFDAELFVMNMNKESNPLKNRLSQFGFS